MNTRLTSTETGLVLKNITAQDFLSFGLHEIAFIKPITVQGKTQYGIYAADGKVLIVLDTQSAALAAILHNNLEPVGLH